MSRPLRPDVIASRAKINAERAARMAAAKGALDATLAAFGDHGRRFAEARLATMAETGNNERPALEGKYGTAA